MNLLVPTLHRAPDRTTGLPQLLAPFIHLLHQWEIPRDPLSQKTTGVLQALRDPRLPLALSLAQLTPMPTMLRRWSPCITDPLSLDPLHRRVAPNNHCSGNASEPFRSNLFSTGNKGVSYHSGRSDPHASSSHSSSASSRRDEAVAAREEVMQAARDIVRGLRGDIGAIFAHYHQADQPRDILPEWTRPRPSVVVTTETKKTTTTYDQHGHIVEKVVENTTTVERQ